MSKVATKNQNQTKSQDTGAKQTKKEVKGESEKKSQGSVKVTDKTAKKLKEKENENDNESTESQTKGQTKTQTKSTGTKDSSTKTQTKGKVTKVAKNKKEDEKDEKEEKEGPNAKTILIGCTLNVNIAKSHMLQFIKKALGMNFGSIKADCAYVAILESVALYLVGATAKYNTKNAEKANLYEVTLENLQRVVRESNEFGSELKDASENYKPEAMDHTSVFFGGGGNKQSKSDKVLKDLLEKKAFTNATNVSINEKAMNYVCYMLTRTMGQLTKTACVLSQFAGLKNIQIKNFRCAVEIHFSDELRQILFQRIDEVTDKVANSKEDATEGDSEAQDNKKSAKKKVTKKEEDEEEEEAEEDAEEEDAEEGEDDDEDDDEEEEVDEE
jgi:hypothetical protein